MPVSCRREAPRRIPPWLPSPCRRAPWSGPWDAGLPAAEQRAFEGWRQACPSRSHLQLLAAVLADAHPGLVLIVQPRMPDAGRLVAVGAYDHDVADLDRHGQVDDARGLGTTALCALVPLGHVDARDDDGQS